MGGGRVLRSAAGAVSGRIRGVVRPRGRASSRDRGGARALSLSSRPSSPLRPASPTAYGPAPPSSSPKSGAWSTVCPKDEDEWEEVSAEEIQNERPVFWRKPTKEEVLDAVTELKQFFEPVNFHQVVECSSPSKSENLPFDTPRSSSQLSVPSESPWIDPSSPSYRHDDLQLGQDSPVHDAFQWLQRSSSIQKMVVSLSTDESLWDAVLNNEAVQEFKKTLGEDAAGGADAGSTDPPGVLLWLLGSARAKLMEVINSVMKMLSGLLKHEDRSQTFEFRYAVSSSLVLTVIVFLVVLAKRARNE